MSASDYVDSYGQPLDAETLGRLFRPIDPRTFDDPVCGEVLRRLAIEDPDVIAAVADVDRSIIWVDLELTPRERSLNMDRHREELSMWRIAG